MNDLLGHAVPVEVAIGDDRDGAAWTDYVRSFEADGHFHAWPWRHIIQRSLKHRPLYLIARRHGAITGVLPLFDVQSRLFGRSLISLPFLNGGGLLSSDTASADALLRFTTNLVLTEGFQYCELRQRQALDNPYNLACRHHKVAMRLPLGHDPDLLFRNFKGKLRSQIRRPTKAGAVAHVVNGQNVVTRDIDAFYAVFSENMRDLGTPVFPKSLFRETLEGFGDNAWLPIVWLDGHPTAAGLMVGFDRSIEMIWASSRHDFNRISVNMLLYWEAMRTAIDHGYQVFDFGRCTQGGSTFRFKAQWGAEPKPLHWYYVEGEGSIPDISPDNPKFHLAVRVWQTLPVAIANRIGPLVARSLP